MDKPYAKWVIKNGEISLRMFVKSMGGVEIEVRPDTEKKEWIHFDVRKRKWLPLRQHKKRMRKLRQERGKAGRKNKDGKRTGAKTRVDKLMPPLDDGFKMKQSFPKSYWTKKDKKKYLHNLRLENKMLQMEFDESIAGWILKSVKNNFVGRRKRSKRNKEGEE